MTQKIKNNNLCVANKPKSRNINIKRLITNNYSGWLILLPSMILFYYIVWRPIFIGSSYSFFKLNGYAPVEFVGWQNYKDVIGDTLFLKTLKNTVAYVIWSLIIGLPLPFITAVMLNEMIFGKEFLKFSIYFPAIMPGIAVSLIWCYIYDPSSSGLLNTILYYFGGPQGQWLQNKNLTIPLIVASMSWRGFGGTTIMYLAALQGINQELYEAARIDGAGFLKKIRHVLLPGMYGVILLLAVRQAITVFQVMEQPLAMTGGGPANASVTLALQSYNYAFVYFQTDKALALGMLTFFMLIGLTFVYFKLDKKINS